MVKKDRFVITSSKLTKSYGNLMALDSIDLEIPHGSVGLLGPNGAGKSTLIKSLLGLLEITSGEASVLGHTLGSRDSGLDIRRRIGYMPESDCLIPSMTAIGFVKYMGEISGLPPMIAMQRAHEVLHYVGIGDERYRKLKTYSTGMKQKVKLAQAIVHDPELVLLDEPTNGMDPTGRKEMLELILDITRNHNKNIIFSSHLLPDVEYLCDHVIIIDQGKLITQGDMKDLIGSIDIMEIKIKGDEAKFASILKGMGLNFNRKGPFFILKSEGDILNDIYAEIRGKNIQIRHASRSKRTLEEIFIKNVGDHRGGVG